MNKLQLVTPETGTIEAGFDLTGFKGGYKLKKFFEKIGVTTRAVRDEKAHAYIFQSLDSKDNKIFMGAHPFANGLLFGTHYGTRGAGYCSYIGITGSKEFTTKVYNFILNNAEYIKEAEFGTRSFV